MEEQHVRSPRLADHPLAGPINPAGCIIHVRWFIHGQRRTETSCLLAAERPVGGVRAGLEMLRVIFSSEGESLQLWLGFVSVSAGAFGSFRPVR